MVGIGGWIKMKKAILNIIIIILTAIICGYLIFTGLEVRNNAEVENAHSKARYETVVASVGDND